MDAQTVNRRLQKHNALQIVLGISMVAGSIILWPLSYWILYGLFHYFFSLLDIGSAGTISSCLAWGGIIILVIEGYRYGRAGIDLNESSSREYARNNAGSPGTGRAASLAFFGVYNPMGMSFIVSQVLLSAPTMSISAIKAFRSFIRTTPDAFEQAARVYNHLSRHRQWFPASEYRENIAGVMLLDRLNMIWKENKTGTMEIRIPPGEGCSSDMA